MIGSYCRVSTEEQSLDRQLTHLVEGENYHQVVAVLDAVMKDETSKPAAARELGTSRPTIDRALDRAELYGL